MVLRAFFQEYSEKTRLSALFLSEDGDGVLPLSFAHRGAVLEATVGDVMMVDV